MRCPLLACGAVAWLAAPAQAHFDLDDTSQLIQSSAHLLEKPQMNATADPRPVKQFNSFMKQLAKKWKQHREDQLAKLEPWKLKELQHKRKKEKEAHHDRVKPQPPSMAAKTAKLLSPQERATIAEEAKRSRYGELQGIVVRDPSGHELLVKTRAEARLQVLMTTVNKKLGLEANATKFVFRERPLDPLSTVKEFGLADQDVVEIDHPVLQAAKEAKEVAEKKAQAAAQLQREVKAEEEKALAAKLERRFRLEKKHAEVAAENKRKHELKRNGMTVLKFVVEDNGPNSHGKEVEIAAKYNNWLKGTMELVCKRMGVDAATARFYRSKDRQEILPTNSIRVLGLKELEVIKVKIPMKKPTEAPQESPRAWKEKLRKEKKEKWEREAKMAREANTDNEAEENSQETPEKKVEKKEHNSHSHSHSHKQQ
mmetsp:Transcript_34180/g.98418  ORF Transcript_34180/g.98418 Transcript_34180/m.98418 type:complete len:426 (-) Transcript_34180:146-1423(-)